MADVLRDALGLVRAGWTKRFQHTVCFDYDTGTVQVQHVYCAIGAMRAAGGVLQHNGPEVRAVVDVIREQFPERVSARGAPPYAFCITSFNDHPLTTQADVELVLEKAAILVEEAV